MKKLSALILASLLILTFAGCGSSGGSDDEDAGITTGGNGGVSSTPKYLCFTAAGGDVDVKIKLESVMGTMSVIPSLEWSNDGTTWTPVALSGPAATETTTNAITTLAVGSKMYIRAISTNSFFSEFNMGGPTVVLSQFVFTGTGNIEASGNVMSLLDKTCASTTIPSIGCFSSLFKGCDKLVSSPILPATTLNDNCYAEMFYGCTALASAPELPATALTPGCYNAMFRGCEALTIAPDLPATSIVSNCYNRMFYDCQSLASMKVYFTAWGNVEDTENWVSNVNSPGKFYHKSGLTDLTKNDNKVPANFTPETF